MWRTWIWRHFEITLPSDWEMLQYTRNPETGRCAFADRYAFRLEMSWRAVAGPPDYDRMLNDYAARLKLEGHQDVRPIRRANWRGVAGAKGRTVFSRYGAFFDTESCVVELVFIWPGSPPDPALEKTVLRAFRECAPDAAGRRRWRAFGMDARVSGDLQLAHCRVAPGEAEWRFEDAKRRCWTRCRRIGLRALWLKQDLGAWLAAQAPRLQSGHTETHTRDGCVVWGWSGRARRGLLEQLVRGARDYWAEAWTDPADDRVYVREIYGPPAFVEAEARGGALSRVEETETVP